MDDILIKKIAENVIKKMEGNSGDTSQTDGWSDESRLKAATSTRTNVEAQKRKLGDIHKKNAEYKKTAKNIKKEQREELISKITEIKNTIDRITTSLPPSMIQEIKFKRFLNNLNEYINMDGERGIGEYGDHVVKETGDEILDGEIQVLDSNTSVPSKFIDQIRKQALEAMATLADNSQSPEFQTMNNIFIQCQKYTNDLNKKSNVPVEEGNKVVPTNSIAQ